MKQGVLLSGPPGTGKTLFARTLAKESGLPFVFASGAEFTDSEKSGAARINEMFSIARRNVRDFLFSIFFPFKKYNDASFRVGVGALIEPKSSRFQSINC